MRLTHSLSPWWRYLRRGPGFLWRVFLIHFREAGKESGGVSVGRRAFLAGLKATVPAVTGLMLAPRAMARAFSEKKKTRRDRHKQGGRPGWFSALQAPDFVVLAGCSGIGMLLILTAAVRRNLGLRGIIGIEAFRFLANFQWILVLIYLYFMAVEELTANYAAGRAESHLAHEMVWGVYAPVFWTVVICFLLALLIGFIQFAAKTLSIAWSVTAAVLVNIAAILKRFLIVVPSRTHGKLLPYGDGT